MGIFILFPKEAEKGACRDYGPEVWWGSEEGETQNLELLCDSPALGLRSHGASLPSSQEEHLSQAQDHRLDLG